MKKTVCGLALLTLFGWATYASDVVRMQSVTPQRLGTAHRGAVYAGNFVMDTATGQVTPGHADARAVTVYDNTQRSQNAFYTTAVGNEVGDDLSMTGGGTLSTLSFSIWNADTSSGPLTAVDITFSFFDRASDVQLEADPSVPPFATFTLTNVPISPALQPNQFRTMDLTGLESRNITVPVWMMAAVRFTNPVGGADALGHALYNGGASSPYFTMAQGESGINFALHDLSGGPPGSWSYGYFGPPPDNAWGNFYFKVGVVTKSPPVLWDTGCAHTILDPGELYVSYYAGNFLSAGLPQRWGAMPFSIAADTTIGQINFNWSDSSPADHVKYIIFHRRGLTVPTSADIYRQGILGAYDPNGLMDRRIHLAGDNSFHQYPNLNIAVAAGDYYLNLYAEDPNDGSDHVFTILAGGMLQPDNCEPIQNPNDPNSAFMWRSASFPTPGFVVYQTTGSAGPEMATDPNQIADMYTFCLQILGTTAPPVCRGDLNCDGQINFNDINPFVAVLSGGTPCSFGNADVNGDGRIDFNDINPFVALLSGGGGPCQ